MKCLVITDFPDRFKEGNRLLLAGDPPTEKIIQSARFVGGYVYLRLSGIDDRETAAALRGTELLVRAEDAVALPEGQFLWRQIIGLRVETPAGDPLGEVTSVLRTSANDVYVVETPQGEMLVPATKEVVQVIAPEQNRMVINLLPGMLPELRKPKRRKHREGASSPMSAI